MPVSAVTDLPVTDQELLKQPSAQIAMIMTSAPTNSAHSMAKTSRPRQKIAPAPFLHGKDPPPSQLKKPPMRPINNQQQQQAMPSSEPKEKVALNVLEHGTPTSGNALHPGDVTTTAPVFEVPALSKSISLKPPVRPAADAFSARAAMLEADAKDEIACFIAKSNGHCRKNQVGKVVFDISGMEFPKDVSKKQLESYFYGKSYRRTCLKAGADQYDFSQHEPWVVTHKFNSKFLFCTITNKMFPRTVDNIEKHTSGARFMRGLKIKKHEMAERKRIAEKKRRNRVEERAAMAEAKKKEKDEYTIRVANYNSEEDDDFNPDAPADDDEKEEMEADKEMEVADDDDEDMAADPLISQLGDNGPKKREKKQKTKSKNNINIVDTTDDPANVGDINMDSMQIEADDNVVDVDALPWVASKTTVQRPPAPSRRSKTKAEQAVAEEAPQLGSDDSSDDEDFAPGQEGSDGEVEEGTSNPTENVIDTGHTNEESYDHEEPSRKIKTQAKQKVHVEHKEEWGINKQYNEDVYVGPPKPEPIVPENSEMPMNFARIRAQIRAKKRTKQALKKAMAKSARQRQVIEAAKEELRREATKKEEVEDDEEKGFWTRGKHNVELDEVRSKVKFDIDTMDDDEWNRKYVTQHNSGNSNNSKKRKYRENRKVPRKSRQDRLRRVMGEKV